ncbi:MAG: polyamine aminopropyltransferase, partial [Pseudoalteromonas marina]
GLWSVTLARKSEAFNGFREDGAAHVATQSEYYNSGIHHGALATPNFMKRAFDKK